MLRRKRRGRVKDCRHPLGFDSQQAVEAAHKDIKRAFFGATSHSGGKAGASNSLAATERKNWNAVTESKRVGSGEIMTTLTGMRSDMFVEETATGQVGILRETWWDAEEADWVGAVEWLAGKLLSERRSRGWSKFKEEGVSWPCVLPNFERWSRVE
jgi:hypothetical protein